MSRPILFLLVALVLASVASQPLAAELVHPAHNPLIWADVPDIATWTTNIADGSFANIQNNPSLQEVSFAPVSARYFRFTSLQAIWNSGWTSAAEISVMPAAGGK